MISLDSIDAEFQIYESSYDDLFVESGVYDLSQSLKVVLVRVIEKMKEFLKNLKADVEVLVTKHNSKKKLKEVLDNAKEIEADKKGKTMVSVFDYRSANKIFEEEIKILSKELTKIAEFEVRSDKDLDKLEKMCNQVYRLMDSFEDEIDAALKQTTKVPVREAITYVEKLINGRNPAYDRYFSLADELEHLINKIEYTMTTKETKAYNISAVGMKKKSVFTKVSGTCSRMMKRVVLASALMF